MELVRAIKCFDHLTCLQSVNAYSTVCLLVVLAWIWFFIFESSVRIDNSANLLGRKLFLLLFLLELLSKVRRWVVWIESTLLVFRVAIRVIGSLLELLLETWICRVESVSIEIHLDMLRIHITHHLR